MNSCSPSAWWGWQPAWWQESLVILGIVAAACLLAIALAFLLVRVLH